MRWFAHRLRLGDLARRTGRRRFQEALKLLEWLGDFQTSAAITAETRSRQAEAWARDQRPRSPRVCSVVSMRRASFITRQSPRDSTSFTQHRSSTGRQKSSIDHGTTDRRLSSESCVIHYSLEAPQFDSRRHGRSPPSHLAGAIGRRLRQNAPPCRPTDRSAWRAVLGLSSCPIGESCG